MVVDDSARQRLLIWSILDNLDERGRHIMIGHYFKNLSMRQIANELALSVSRTRKLHKQMLSTLRERLAVPSVNDNDQMVRSRYGVG